MAERLKQGIDEFSSFRKFPWDQWGDGTVWRLRRGEDFEGPAAHFRQTVYNAAAARGKRASVRLESDESLVIQFREKEGADGRAANGGGATSRKVRRSK